VEKEGGPPKAEKNARKTKGKSSAEKKETVAADPKGRRISGRKRTLKKDVCHGAFKELQKSAKGREVLMRELLSLGEKSNLLGKGGGLILKGGWQSKKILVGRKRT